jgi:hypothetical protein
MHFERNESCVFAMVHIAVLNSLVCPGRVVTDRSNKRSSSQCAPWENRVIEIAEEGKMKNSKNVVSVFILFALLMIGVSAQAQRQPSNISTRQVRGMLQRLETSSNRFRNTLNAALAQERIGVTRSQNDINSFESEFETAVSQFRDRFTRRQAEAADVQKILQKASLVNDYLNRNRLGPRVQNDWAQVRTDLNALANAYGIRWQWNQQYTDYSGSRLTGTFRLDPSRSDNPRDVGDRVTRSLSSNERQAVHDRIIARLESPEMLAIERRGSTLTMASSLAPQSTFEADGVERQEQLNGRISRVTATLRGDQLTVRSTGSRNDDFTVTFEAVENGNRLRVSRQIYSDRLNQPVLVRSIYERTSEVAQWNIYDGSRPGNVNVNMGEFIVRDGETVVAVLNNDLTTKQTKQGDHFTMTVREPGEFQGAVIEGTVSSVTQSGRLTGRSGMTLNFETIRLRNGQTYRFGGILTSVRTLKGDTVKVDNEGTAQGDKQTTQTVTRAGIGTAIGAIIGAVAGGGKGAAIGGIIGAVGGAGSVYVQGKDNLELPTGTELTIRSSAPAR